MDEQAISDMENDNLGAEELREDDKLEHSLEDKPKRNDKGRFIQTTPNGWKAKGSEYQRKYYLNHPWAKHLCWSKGRAKKKGWKHTLNVNDFKKLWERCLAHNLKSPSIDRIDPKLGYIEGNCRFIERSFNISLGNRRRKNTEKQTEAGYRNLRMYRQLKSTLWNKKTT